MPPSAEIVAGELEAVGGGHDANQVPRAALDVFVELGAQVRPGFEKLQNNRDARSILIDLGHDAPLFAATCRKRQPRIDEIRAPPAADQSFLFDRKALPEAVELC